MRKAKLMALGALRSRREFRSPMGAAKPYLAMGPTRFRDRCHITLLFRRLFSRGALENQGDWPVVYQPYLHVGPEHPDFYRNALGHQSLHEPVV